MPFVILAVPALLVAWYGNVGHAGLASALFWIGIEINYVCRRLAYPAIASKQLFG